MLQVVKREFKKLDELVIYTNNTSIDYGYLKNYQIINENDKYTLLLNFDVPECKQLLELTKLKKRISNDNIITNTNYKIELENKSIEIHSDIEFRRLKHGFNIQSHFGYDGTFDLIEVNYVVLKDHFTIELRKFDYDNISIGLTTTTDNVLCVKNIEYKIIYDHLVKLIFNRGYILDKASLNKLENNLCSIGKWLNRKDFLLDGKKRCKNIDGV